MSKGPGPVAAAHRLLIVTALVGAVVYLGWEVRAYARDGEARALLAAGLALVACVAIGLYLRSLRTLRARLTPRDPGAR